MATKTPSDEDVKIALRAILFAVTAGDQKARGKRKPRTPLKASNSLRVSLVAAATKFAFQIREEEMARAFVTYFFDKYATVLNQYRFHLKVIRDPAFVQKKAKLKRKKNKEMDSVLNQSRDHFGRVLLEHIGSFGAWLRSYWIYNGVKGREGADWQTVVVNHLVPSVDSNVFKRQRGTVEVAKSTIGKLLNQSKGWVDDARKGSRLQLGHDIHGLKRQFSYVLDLLAFDRKAKKRFFALLTDQPNNIAVSRSAELMRRS